MRNTKHSNLYLKAIVGAFALLLAFAGCTVQSSNQEKTPTAPTLEIPPTETPPTESAQEATLTYTAQGYTLNPPTLKKGIPARITVDLSSVRGCYRSIRIPDLGVSANVGQGNNVFEFTPPQAGQFHMTCSMGMGTGTLVVTE